MSVVKIREFPALLMTALFIVASLSSTGCLREMVRQKEPILPSSAYLGDDLQYYAPDPEFKLAQVATVLQEQETNNR